MKRPWLWWVVVLLIAGCGYRFSGGGGLPGNVSRVCVKMLENRTVETGVESLLTNDLIYEFTRSGTFSPDEKKADACLSGVVASISRATVSRVGIHTSQERRVTLTMALRLTDSAGQVIWSAKGLSDNEEYQVVPDKPTTERNRRAAIEVLSRRLAEKVYQQLTNDF